MRYDAWGLNIVSKIRIKLFRIKPWFTNFRG